MRAELPGPLCLPAAFPFVGRAGELATLRALLPSETRRVVLLGGEAGSGKSRLVREFAREADALVLYGACDAVVHAPYGPFIEALDRLDRDAVRAAAGPAGGELARLLPDLADGAPRADADPDTVRLRLHTAVTDLLVALSRERPLLLVLEDAHWADAPTLALLRHLARAGVHARLVLMATFRDAEAPDALSETLADLRRSDDVVRLRLNGLSDDDVGEFVRRAGGDDPQLAHTIHELTAGNPFLVCELWRALAEGELGPELGSPESVREVVGRRLARLAPATAEALALAATAGAEFGLDVLRAAERTDDATLMAALDEALRSGMLGELPSLRLSYRFTHELVRRALYDGLSGLRRAELHLRVGEALEALGTGGPAELAHHFTAAAPLAGPERGVRYNVHAAEAATAALDYDAAAKRLGVALELGVADPDRRAGLLIELGSARHRAGGSVDALAAFAEAARTTDAPELLARAAIGYEEACWRPVITDEVAVPLLENAAWALGDEPSRLRVGVLGGLARTLLIRGEYDRGGAVRAQALAMAHALGDRLSLANVLVTSYWARERMGAQRVLSELAEARDIAAQIGRIDLESEAMNWRVAMLTAVGDLDAVCRELALVKDLAERTAQPFHLHVVEHGVSAIALCEGRIEEAEAAALRSREWSRLLTGRDASGVYGIQMFSLRREQDRLGELAPLIHVLARAGGHWRPGLASLLVELGMEDEARRQLARVAADGLDEYRASLWIASLTYLTDACGALGDERVAALLYPELEPLAGTYVMIGHVVACYGSADRFLGVLAATLGEDERAERHFEVALAANRRMGAQTWLAHTAYEYGRMLHVGGARERAAPLLAEASALAERHGLAALRRRIAALASTPAPPDGLSYREVQILGLVAEGMSNREIGGALFISEHTAANHIRSILRKTRCANRTEAATYAHRHGLVRA